MLSIKELLELVLAGSPPMTWRKGTFMFRWDWNTTSSCVQGIIWGQSRQNVPQKRLHHHCKHISIHMLTYESPPFSRWYPSLHTKGCLIAAGQVQTWQCTKARWHPNKGVQALCHGAPFHPLLYLLHQYPPSGIHLPSCHYSKEHQTTITRQLSYSCWL